MFVDVNEYLTSKRKYICLEPQPVLKGLTEWEKSRETKEKAGEYATQTISILRVDVHSKELLKRRQIIKPIKEYSFSARGRSNRYQNRGRSDAYTLIVLDIKPSFSPRPSSSHSAFPIKKQFPFCASRTPLLFRNRDIPATRTSQSDREIQLYNRRNYLTLDHAGSEGSSLADALTNFIIQFES